MVKFSPFITLLLLGAAAAETLLDPSEWEEQGDRGLAVGEQEDRRLAYGEWANPRIYERNNIRASNERYVPCVEKALDIAENCGQQAASCVRDCDSLDCYDENCFLLGSFECFEATNDFVTSCGFQDYGPCLERAFDIAEDCGKQAPACVRSCESDIACYFDFCADLGTTRCQVQTQDFAINCGL